jgi:hypothetical protein
VKVLGKDGKPVQGATVIISDVNDPPRYARAPSLYELDERKAGPPPWYTLQTDKDGMAEYDCLYEGKFAVRAYTRDSDISDEMIVEMKPGAAASIVMDFGKSTMLALQVVDKDTGKSVENLNALMRNGSYMMLGKRMPLQKESEHIIIGPWMIVEKDKARVLLYSSAVGDTVVINTQGYKAAEYPVKEMPKGKTTEVKVEIESLGFGALKVTLVPGQGMKPDDIGKVRFSNYIPASEPVPDKPHDCVTVAPTAGVAEARDMYARPCYMSIYDKNGQFLAVYRLNVEKDHRDDGDAAGRRINRGSAA